MLGDKDSFIQTLLENIYRGMTMAQEEYTREAVEERLRELHQEMMSLVRLNAKARTGANAFDQEYAEVAAEIELMQQRKQKLNDAELEKLTRRNKVEELREYLTSQDTPLAKFDGDLFRRLVEKVIVHSMVEVTFVFRSGVEVREIVG